MINKIIGRQREKIRLNSILEGSEAAFLAVYGRRRIGKTYLIENFFKDKGVFFHLTGIQEGSLDVQLHNFAMEFSDCFLKGKEIVTPVDWFSALKLLRTEISKIPTSTKIILFFDELPWLSSPRSMFLQALEHLWNRYLSSMPNIILIVCGSAAAWMIDHIIDNKGGLYGRVTAEMRLLPFSLRETEEFLLNKKIEFDRKQILELYMCVGGVAKYLSYVERGKSVVQMIGELCFSYNAPLIAEFHRLYRSLFHNHEEYIKIITLLAKSQTGLSYQEITEKGKFSAGGTLSKRIQELKLSGFIAEIPAFGEGEKGYCYVLIDEYSLFYLRWHAGVSALDLQNRGVNYWVKQRNTQAWKSWMGYAFESLCLKHIHEIKVDLGIAGVLTEASTWRYFPAKGSGESGAEIDIVIDRADSCINLCELKFYDDKFVITKEYATKLKQKRSCFERITETRKATFTTLITPYGAVHNTHFLQVIDKELTMDSLFSL